MEWNPLIEYPSYSTYFPFTSPDTLSMISLLYHHDSNYCNWHSKYLIRAYLGDSNSNWRSRIRIRICCLSISLNFFHQGFYYVYYLRCFWNSDVSILVKIWGKEGGVVERFMEQVKWKLRMKLAEDGILAVNLWQIFMKDRW